MGYDKFVEFIFSFLKIDGSKLEVNMKFNPDMKEMTDWYDIVDDDILSIFFCYAIQDPKKYHLFVLVSEKVDGYLSFRSNKESVKDNHATNFGDNYLDFFGDKEVHGFDYIKEDYDVEKLFDEDFF